MAYYIRPMRKEDIPQVKVIDREAFPTMMPPPNFERELNNQMTHFYVVCDEEKSFEQEYTPATPGFLSKVKEWFFSDNGSTEDTPAIKKEPYICGYVGFWVMADEAHITTIAVKEEAQRKGIGELLMMAVFDRAKALYASVLTLEVRVSNTGAQDLYLKYGFNNVGVRKHYYTDNREDAYIMTTEDITTGESQKMLRELKDKHASRWGKANFNLSEKW